MAKYRCAACGKSLNGPLLGLRSGERVVCDVNCFVAIGGQRTWYGGPKSTGANKKTKK